MGNKIIRNCFVIFCAGLIFGCSSPKSSSIPANPTNSPSNQTTKVKIPSKTLTVGKISGTFPFTITPSQDQTPTLNLTSWFMATSYKSTQDFIDSYVKTKESFHIDCFPGELISPDGKWLTCPHDTSTELSGMYIKKYSDTEFQDITIEKLLENYSKNAPWDVSPILFSKDMTYLFFSTQTSGDGGDRACFFGDTTNGIFKMDLSSKNIDPIIVPDYAGNKTLYFKFSPTERRLAYYYINKNTLHILDLKTGENNSYEFPERINERLIWSPDGTKLAFITGLDDEKTVNSSTVRIFDTQSGETRTVFHSTDQCLSVNVWRETNNLMVTGRSNVSDDMIFEINLNTNFISLITPTP
jgi:hypothetical protein